MFSVADVEEPGFTAAEEDGDDAGESSSTEAAAEAAQAAEDESEPAGIRTAIIISKDGKGAITFDALADGPLPSLHCLEFD